MHQVTQVNFDARNHISGASLPADSSIKSKAPKENPTIRVVQAKAGKSAPPKNTENEDVPAVVATSLLSENPNDPAVRSADEAHAIILELASLGKLDYALKRKTQAKRMLMSVSTLDSIVKDYKDSAAQSGNRPYSVVELHPEPIDPAILLNEITAAIRRHVVLDDEQATAVALWIALTWFIDEVQFVALLLISAPEKGCGKTQFLEVIKRSVKKPEMVANSSAAAFFRIMDQHKPTMLFDEGDTVFKDKTEFHGMLNAGHSRGGYVLRCESVGGCSVPRRFDVYGAKAIAGISIEKHLPESTMSRGVLIQLKRKLPDEAITSLRDAEVDLFSTLASKLARFAADYAEQVRQFRPACLRPLSDRAQNNWDPMLSIASCAGEGWVNRATAAAVKLSSTERTQSIENELLADVRDAFAVSGATKLRTADLIDALCADEEKAWATVYRGGRITPRNLSDMLDKYGIAPKTIRIGTQLPKGYELSQFADAFARYLPALPQHAATPQHSAGGIPAQG